jgi:hypothetical protein
VRGSNSEGQSHSQGCPPGTSLNTWSITDNPRKNALIVGLITGAVGGILSGFNGAKYPGGGSGVRTYYAKRTVCQGCAEELYKKSAYRPIVLTIMLLHRRLCTDVGFRSRSMKEALSIR